MKNMLKTIENWTRNEVKEQWFFPFIRSLLFLAWISTSRTFDPSLVTLALTKSRKLSSSLMISLDSGDTLLMHSGKTAKGLCGQWNIPTKSGISSKTASKRVKTGWLAGTLLAHTYHNCWQVGQVFSWLELETIRESRLRRITGPFKVNVKRQWTHVKRYENTAWYIR